MLEVARPPRRPRGSPALCATSSSPPSPWVFSLWRLNTSPTGSCFWALKNQLFWGLAGNWEQWELPVAWLFPAWPFLH